MTYLSASHLPNLISLSWDIHDVGVYTQIVKGNWTLMSSKCSTDFLTDVQTRPFLRHWTNKMSQILDSQPTKNELSCLCTLPNIFLSVLEELEQICIRKLYFASGNWFEGVVRVGVVVKSFWSRLGWFPFPRFKMSLGKWEWRKLLEENEEEVRMGGSRSQLEWNNGGSGDSDDLMIVTQHKRSCRCHRR